MIPLTILTLFTGNRMFLEPYRQALGNLKKPENTQLLLVDNSQDGLFHEKLKALSRDTVAFEETLEKGIAEDLSPLAQFRKAQHCARLYNFCKPYIRGTDLLILEHDVIPRPDALEKLKSSREFYRADLISAAIISRTTGEYLGWRFKKNGVNIDRVLVTRRPKRVLATGFGFILMKTEIYRAMNLTARDERYSFFGSDILAGVWAREKGLRWFLDGGVRCRHLNENGTSAGMGYRANVQVGPLKTLQIPEQCPL